MQNDQVKQKQLQMGGENFRSCDDPACWTQIAPFATNSSKLVLSKKKCSEKKVLELTFISQKCSILEKVID